MTVERQLTYAAALNEALDIAMAADPRVFVMGLGTPDALGVFGTTKGLAERHGAHRVLDTPVSESAMTGVALGAAITGSRPVITHLRLEFAMVAIDQIVNQAAKWRYMFGGRASAPIVMRMIVGRGWGQGPQHSQSLQAWFAHVPGLKVIMPATPRDAKGMLIAAIEDDDPVVCIEHRWLYGISGPVPEGSYRVPLGEPTMVVPGDDVTLVSTSYMTLEATRAAEQLARDGVSVEVIDVRTLNPFDHTLVVESVRRTGRLIVADTGARSVGFAAEVLARVAESGVSLRAAPMRLTLPDVPTPTTRALANRFYPTVTDIVVAAHRLMGREIPSPSVGEDDLLDVPDSSFTGPF